MSDTDYDVLIVGGGMVGASLACSLAKHPLRVALIEAVPYGGAAQPSYDDRSIALAYGSHRIFIGMGLWPEIAPQATPIKRIHVSDRGHFGAVRMDATSMGCAALGYVVENRVLGGVFARLLPTYDNVEFLCPARLQEFKIDADRIAVRIDAGGVDRNVSARLLIGADGGRSAVRELAGISAAQSDYRQSAVIANVTPERDHGFIAYERFTSAGPLAMLPLSEGRCSLVWTVATPQAQGVIELSDADFLLRLQEQFGMRLGALRRVGRRAVYPLSLIRAHKPIRDRVALIGNAAHTLHPIAGQGFNLGLRDVAVLAEVLVEAHLAGRDIGSRQVLQSYEAWRSLDQRRVMAMTDGLVRLFSNEFTPLVVARNAGLMALDALPPLKRMLMRQTMGVVGRQPRLGRGLPL